MDLPAVLTWYRDPVCRGNAHKEKSTFRCNRRYRYNMPRIFFFSHLLFLYHLSLLLLLPISSPPTLPTPPHLLLPFLFSSLSSSPSLPSFSTSSLLLPPPPPSSLLLPYPPRPSPPPPLYPQVVSENQDEFERYKQFIQQTPNNQNNSPGSKSTPKASNVIF